MEKTRSNIVKYILMSEMGKILNGSHDSCLAQKKKLNKIVAKIVASFIRILGFSKQNLC